MNRAVEALRRESQQLLAVLQAGTPGEALAEPLKRRQESLIVLNEALTRGERVTDEEARELRRLDQEILQAIGQRRNDLFSKLESLYRRRRVRKTYGGREDTTACFLDRAG